MTILAKGPYSRKDYINIQDNLEEQTDNLGIRIERVKNNAILITCVVALLYCIGTFIYLWPHRYEPLDTIALYWIGGGVSILIIALIAYYFSVRPYNRQIAQLFKESEQLEKYYYENLVEVPLSEYIDKIEVQGDKVTFPPLNELDERYLYDRYSYYLDDDEHDERQIFRLCPDFYENDYLRTEGCGQLPITRDECLMLQAKGSK